MKVLLAFLFGMLIGVGSFCGYLDYKNPNPGEVLAERIETEPTHVLALSTTEPSASVSPSPEINTESSPSPTEAASPSTTPSLKPSPSPSIRPTPSPSSSPSPRISPSPPAIPSPSPSPRQSTSPTPSSNPTATPDVWSPPSMEPLFAQYASQYSVDKNTLERIANCESHFNPNAVNGGYLGMFQFATSSWQSNRNLMGLDNNPALRTNVEESIRTAAFLLARSGTSPWPSCV